ncbi:transposase [Plectonema radiosum NIES-515]|uniref:Transposase n=1 Tax=Plectonema radiosum NIES-515 TaxID=2986073 RepID=A0ABT3B8H1_9CYAN|nr:transposase [Plectonema radiosum]MCV3217260.1 transposase [Plectonema radiosum NIES-515]
MENFTDLQAWAVEQWEDAELGDNRRTDRAIARLCSYGSLG